jgi:methylmalonyl-CoA mutase
MENHTDFIKITPADWKELLQKELKNIPLDALQWNVAQGISAEPAYLDYSTEPVVCIPKNKNIEGWKVAEKVSVDSLSIANQEALNLLMNGVNELIFEGRIAHSEDLKTLLHQIELPFISLFFQPNGAVAALPDFFAEYLKSNKNDPESLNGGINFDPIATLLTRGNWVQNEYRDFETCNAMIAACVQSNLKNFKPVCINATVYHLAGADAVEELACALAHANEYLTRLSQIGIEAKDTYRHLHFRFAMGRGFYTQLCKIRAFRPLWANLCKAHGIEPAKTTAVHITCETSLYEQTLADRHNNLLRATTQAMSAILGGCNSLLVHPFDGATGSSSDFSKRIARNIQLVLNEEAFMGQPADAAAGSYLFESLTNQMMEQAWKRFQEIEAEGGLIEGIKNGTIQNQIEAQAKATQQEIFSGKIVFVGVNKYPASEKPLTENVEKEAFLESKQVRPLQLIRATRSIEQQQLQSL